MPKDLELMNESESNDEIIEQEEDGEELEENNPSEEEVSTITEYDLERLNAIYEMLPLIKECHRICMFMLENR